MLRTLIAFAIVTSAPAIAAAQGYCMSAGKRSYEADRLDEIAKKDGDTSGSLLWCVLEGPDEGMEMAKPRDLKIHAAFRKRAVTACTTIAARTPTYGGGGIVDACTNLLVEEGTKKLGTVDLVARILARPRTWTDHTNLRAIAITKDGKARTMIIDAIRAALKDTAGKKLDLGGIGEWISFRVDALAALEIAGTKADLPLVDEIVASMKGLANIAGQKESEFITPAANKARAALAKR